MNLRLHAFDPASRANGPGLRAVVWFQGCSLACPGCFNPDSHTPAAGTSVNVRELAERILAGPDVLEGVTFSGGEPFQQPEALLELLLALERFAPPASAPLTTLAFSGYTRPEVDRLTLGSALLAHLDVLIAGRFVQSRPVGTGLLGSSNQQVHFLTPRYGPRDLAGVPDGEAILHPDGTVTLTGISPTLPRSWPSDPRPAWPPRRRG
ncbi:MAG: radical SAM protein [Planctomycetes bacterium]|nr:radical SAM protein [Planctomycetota bacterium]